MSSANADHEHPPRRRPVDRPLDARSLARRATMTARAVAFWSAVALPFASLAVLFGGPVTRVDFLVLLVLLSTNVAALYVGRSYVPERAEGGAHTDGGGRDTADDDTAGGDDEAVADD